MRDTNLGRISDDFYVSWQLAGSCRAPAAGKTRLLLVGAASCHVLCLLASPPPHLPARPPRPPFTHTHTSARLPACSPATVPPSPPTSQPAPTTRCSAERSTYPTGWGCGLCLRLWLRLCGSLGSAPCEGQHQDCGVAVPYAPRACHTNTHGPCSTHPAPAGHVSQPARRRTAARHRPRHQR